MGRGDSDKKKIPVRLTQRQVELLDRVDEVYGNNRAEKIRTILAHWLAEDLDDRLRDEDL